MLFYVSGEYSDMVLAHVVEQRAPLLSSFAYDSWAPRCRYIASKLRGTQGPPIKHMLDSGAFTTWSKGKAVDLDVLEDTCNRLQQEYGDCIEWTFVSLDVIPGAPGREITAQDAATACKGSAENYERLYTNVEGRVMPVFHTGDPAWLAEAYANAEFVGLGMSQALNEERRVEGATRMAALFPGKKLHGLASTGNRMLRAAPWYSVDSAAWIYSAAMGGVALLMPSGRLWNLAVSDNSPKTKDFDAHLSTLPPLLRQAAEDRFTARGFTAAALATDYEQRWLWNITEYDLACQNAEQRRATQPAYQQGGLFDA